LIPIDQADPYLISSIGKGAFDVAPATCKAVRCGYMWNWSKTAEARRKPVLIDRFHLTHPHPAKPYPLSAMMK
ncbi:hypothetical protein ACKUCW_004945, partial [Escherichia coli]